MRNGSAVALAARIFLTALLLAPTAAPAQTLFLDDFERGSLGAWSATDNSRAGITRGSDVSQSPNRGAYTRRGPVSLTSPVIDAAVPAARLSYWVRRGRDDFSENPDNGEDLAVEYRRADSTWATIVSYPGGGTPGEVLTGSFELPPDALHAGLALRFRQVAGTGSNNDWWHIDDVSVVATTPAAPLGIGSCEDFSAGLAGNWTIDSSGGSAGVSDATFQSPTLALFLNGGPVTVTSRVIDTSDPSLSALSLWLRRGADSFSEDPDFFENLVVEYLTSGGGWAALETFVGFGAAGEIFVRSWNLPADGRHAGFRLRFRQTFGSGAGYDFWHIDDVCFEQLAMPELLITKVVTTVSDPVNGNSNPKAIPGARLRYTIGVSNQGPGGIDADSIALTEVVPPGTALFVDDSAGDPIAFADGSVASGLAWSFPADVEFSSQPGGGPPYDYSPVPDAQGYDAAVTGLRMMPSGAMNGSDGAGSPSFNLSLDVRVQ